MRAEQKKIKPHLMTTSTNMALSKKSYVHLEKWREPMGPFLIIPSIGYWPNRVFANQDEGSSWVLGFWGWRWRVNIVKIKPAHPPYPNEQEWEAFSAWSNDTFARAFSMEQMRTLFDQQPEWKELVARQGIELHYIRVLLARELAQMFPDTKKS